MGEKSDYTLDWDKTFPKSDKVKHSKISFHNRYGITLVADLYIPKDSENLLVAGRCISVDHDTQASIRIMPIVCCIGQAAGTAAAIAVKDNKNVKDIDVEKLRNVLKDNNVCC